MLGTLSLAAAILFVVLALARLRGSKLPSLGAGALVAALLGGGLALAHWQGGIDSRWMVAGLLLLGAGALSLPKGNRTVAIGAIILGILGALLIAVAMGTAR